MSSGWIEFDVARVEGEGQTEIKEEHSTLAHSPPMPPTLSTSLEAAPVDGNENVTHPSKPSYLPRRSSQIGALDISLTPRTMAQRQAATEEMEHRMASHDYAKQVDRIREMLEKIEQEEEGQKTETVCDTSPSTAPSSESVAEVIEEAVKEVAIEEKSDRVNHGAGSVSAADEAARLEAELAAADAAQAEALAAELEREEAEKAKTRVEALKAAEMEHTAPIVPIVAAVESKAVQDVELERLLAEATQQRLDAERTGGEHESKTEDKQLHEPSKPAVPVVETESNDGKPKSSITLSNVKDVPPSNDEKEPINEMRPPFSSKSPPAVNPQSPSSSSPILAQIHPVQKPETPILLVSKADAVSAETNAQAEAIAAADAEVASLSREAQRGVDFVGEEANKEDGARPSKFESKPAIEAAMEVKSSEAEPTGVGASPSNVGGEGAEEVDEEIEDEIENDDTDGVESLSSDALALAATRQVEVERMRLEYENRLLLDRQRLAESESLRLQLEAEAKIERQRREAEAAQQAADEAERRRRAEEMIKLQVELMAQAEAERERQRKVAEAEEEAAREAECVRRRVEGEEQRRRLEEDLARIRLVAIDAESTVSHERQRLAQESIEADHRRRAKACEKLRSANELRDELDRHHRRRVEEWNQRRAMLREAEKEAERKRLLTNAAQKRIIGEEADATYREYATHERERRIANRIAAEVDAEHAQLETSYRTELERRAQVEVNAAVAVEQVAKQAIELARQSVPQHGRVPTIKDSALSFEQPIATSLTLSPSSLVDRRVDARSDDHLSPVKSQRLEDEAKRRQESERRFAEANEALRVAHEERLAAAKARLDALDAAIVLRQQVELREATRKADAAEEKARAARELRHLRDQADRKAREELARVQEEARQIAELRRMREREEARTIALLKQSALEALERDAAAKEADEKRRTEDAKNVELARVKTREWSERVAREARMVEQDTRHRLHLEALDAAQRRRAEAEHALVVQLANSRAIVTKYEHRNAEERLRDEMIAIANTRHESCDIAHQLATIDDHAIQEARDAEPHLRDARYELIRQQVVRDLEREKHEMKQIERRLNQPTQQTHRDTMKPTNSIPNASSSSHAGAPRRSTSLTRFQTPPRRPQSAVYSASETRRPSSSHSSSSSSLHSAFTPTGGKRFIYDRHHHAVVNAVERQGFADKRELDASIVEAVAMARTRSRAERQRVRSRERLAAEHYAQTVAKQRAEAESKEAEQQFIRQLKQLAAVRRQQEDEAIIARLEVKLDQETARIDALRQDASKKAKNRRELLNVDYLAQDMSLAHDLGVARLHASRANHLELESRQREQAIFQRNATITPVRPTSPAAPTTPSITPTAMSLPSARNRTPITPKRLPPLQVTTPPATPANALTHRKQSMATQTQATPAASRQEELLRSPALSPSEAGWILTPDFLRTLNRADYPMLSAYFDQADKK